MSEKYAERKERGGNQTKAGMSKREYNRRYALNRRGGPHREARRNRRIIGERIARLEAPAPIAGADIKRMWYRFLGAQRKPRIKATARSAQRTARKRRHR